MHKEGMKVKGYVVLHVKCVDTDEIVQTFEGANLFLDLGRLDVVKLLGGDPAGVSITQFGVGTSNTAPTNADNALTGAFIKNLNTGGSVNLYTTNTVTFGYRIDNGEANGITIQEVGLYSASNVLVARKTLSTPIVKTSSFYMDGTWTIQIN